MKKKLFISLIALLLLCFIASAFAGCTEKPVNGPSASTDGEKPTAEAATAEVTEVEPPDTYYVPGIKYNDTEFTVLCPGKNDGEWECKDFYAEEDSDDAVVSAVFQRQKLIEDTYGVKIQIIEDVSRSSINALVKKDVMGGDPEYDLVLQVMSAAYTLAQSKYLANLESIPYLDLKSDVWDQSYLAQSSIAGQNYFATGEITTMDNDGTWVMMFNKKLAEDYDLDIYSYVNKGEWTFDKLYEITKDLYQSADGSGKPSEKDTFGIATTIDFIQGMFYAADGKIIRKSTDDIPYLDFNTELNSKIIDNIIKIYYSANKVTFDCHDFVSAAPGGAAHLLAPQMVEENRALCYSEVMQCALRLRTMDTNYGIIPMPKFNISQEHYTTHSVAAVTLCAMISKGIAAKQDRFELAGMIMQALAVEGKNILTPAYYEKSLIAKGTRDFESADMLPIIFANRTCDIGYMAEESQVSSLYQAMRTMVKKGKNTLANTTKSYESKINKALTKLIDAFQAAADD